MMEQTKKRLVILGAAESGVGAAVLGSLRGWDVFVSDAGAIKEQFRTVLEEYGIPWEEKHHSVDKILDADCIVKSPGIPEKAEIMKAIRKAGIEVCSEIEFGFRYKGESRIIAITGSNGKSTTTKLIYATLSADHYDVALVGNIGYSFARRIAEHPAAWYVIEVSSFQLDDIHSFRPDVAVLLNITPDHLDRYNYDFNNYVISKFRITENQTGSDYLVINKDDEAIRDYLTTHVIHANTIGFTMETTNSSNEGGSIRDEKIILNVEGESMDMSIHDLSLKGKHNQYNCMAAGISSMAVKVRKERIREVFSAFEGLEHRLEFVAKVRGVTFINDSKATNLNSVWYALECMTDPVVLIMGGQDKGNDYNEILNLVKQKVKAIICLGKDNTPIHNAFDSVVPNIVDTYTASDAVLAAYAYADKGDVVLLSPACASFDLFNNFEDRGAQFKAAVKNL